MASPTTNAEKRLLLKVVVIGDIFVGKSSLLVKLTTDIFPPQYFPSIFDTFVTSYDTKDGHLVNLSFIDTTGGEDFDRLRPLSYPETDVFLISFSIESRESFASVERKWWPEANQYGKDVPRILLGTKSDLREDSKTIERLRAKNQTLVAPEEAEEMAMKIGAVAYTEVSALEGVGLDALRELTAIVGRKHALAETIPVKNSEKCQVM